MKAPSAAKSMALPVAVEVSTAPLASVIFAPEPAVVVIAIAPAPALIEPRLSDCALFSVKAPMVPLVETAPSLLAPVRLSVPAPLSAKVPAVMTPAPDNIAPDANETVAVPAPTFRLPVSASVPALTVVAPV